MKKISLITIIALLATLVHLEKISSCSIAEIIGLFYGSLLVAAILVYGISDYLKNKMEQS